MTVEPSVSVCTVRDEKMFALMICVIGIIDLWDLHAALAFWSNHLLRLIARERFAGTVCCASLISRSRT